MSDELCVFCGVKLGRDSGRGYCCACLRLDIYGSDDGVALTPAYRRARRKLDYEYSHMVTFEWSAEMELIACLCVVMSVLPIALAVAALCTIGFNPWGLLIAPAIVLPAIVLPNA